MGEVTTHCNFPTLALSVRQPWAWAIIHAGKDIENRAWGPNNPGLRFRGRVAIHASKGMTRDEYADCKAFVEQEIGLEVPPAWLLDRGAIIGAVTVGDVVRSSDSPWYFGPVGLRLSSPDACQPIPAKGELGFFKWAMQGQLELPAKWMLAA